MELGELNRWSIPLPMSVLWIFYETVIKLELISDFMYALSLEMLDIGIDLCKSL